MRLFTAILFDEETKNALCMAQTAAKKNAEGNFTARENLHQTLVFIGETDQREEIEKILSGTDFEPFEIRLSGTGFFEKGIFYASAENSPELSALQNEIEQKLCMAGFEIEKRRYVPHITLARKFRKGGDFSEEEVSAFLAGRKIRIEKISLMESSRIDNVLKYTEIYSKKAKT